jgi:hypothetical protein
VELNPVVDQLAIFTETLRTTGAWCDTSVKDRFAHYFISKHPTAQIAISLCGSVVKPIEKLHTNTVTHKCLICALYIQVREEALSKIISQLNQAIEDEQNKSTDNEKGKS